MAAPEPEDVVRHLNASTPGAFSPLRYPVFRAIWIANLFSNLGGTIQSVGAAWMMTGLTTSTQLVALVQSSATLPIMLFGIIAPRAGRSNEGKPGTRKGRFGKQSRTKWGR